MPRLHAPLRLLCALSLALLAAGCRGYAVPQAPPTEAGSGEGQARSGLDCEHLLPSPVRARFLKNTEVREVSLAPLTLICSASRGGGLMSVHLKVDCRPTTTFAQWQGRADDLRRQKGWKDVPGLGRGAVGNDTQVDVYDDDADCQLSLRGYDGKPVVELARELTHTLVPSLLPAPETGQLTLDCARLLPDGLRRRLAPGARLEASAVMADATECMLRYPDRSADVVTYNCFRRYDATFIERLVAQYASNETPATPVPVGAAGLFVSTLGGPRLAFVDADLGCLVSVTRSRGDQASTVELARAVDAVLTDATAE